MAEKIKEPEKYAHICVFCEDSFMNDNEHLRVCEKCYRKGNLDLALMDRDSMFVEKLDSLGKRANDSLGKVHREFIAKYDKQRKIMKRWTWTYGIIVVIYFSIVVVDNVIDYKENYTIQGHQTECHDVDWYVKDGMILCEECDKDVSVEVLNAVKELKPKLGDN